MDRKKSLRDAQTILMTARDAGGNWQALYHVWKYLRNELDSMPNPSYSNRLDLGEMMVALQGGAR